MAQRRLTILLLGAIIVTTALIGWPKRSERPPDSASTSENAAVAGPAADLKMPAVADAAPISTASVPTLVAPTIPQSLADSDIDGNVELDASGLLRPTQSLRRLFDQVLSSVGELSIEQIRALLSTRLDQLTSADGKRQALAAFERYLRYLQGVDQAAARLSGLPLRERLAALVDLRRQQLGDDMAAAFFAEEEAYQRFTLDRRELADTANLTDDERGARERELIAALPESAREPFLAQRQIESDLTDSAAIDTLASDAAERHRLRLERFGEEAAARMELLDRERQAWDSRVSGYQAERARLQSADSAVREAALAAYLGRHFSEPEQRRIRSLEDIGAL